MSKKKSTKSAKSKQPSHAKSSPIIEQVSAWMNQHHVLSAFIFYLIIIFVFFQEVVFQGEIFFVPDSQAPAALNAPLWKLLNEQGIHAFWSPYIFCGIPTYGSLTFIPFVYFPYLALSLFHIPSSVLAILHFPFAGLGIYLILRDQKVEFLPALLSGMAFMLTPHLISMETFGHGSKLMTVIYLPLAFWSASRLFNQGGLKYLGLTALLLGFQFQRGHVQIVYYTWMLLGLYVLFVLIRNLKNGEGAKALKPVGQIALVLALSLGMAAMLYLPLLEYTPYSIRGAASIYATAATDTGVGFDYATQWSFSPGEMMTFLIPAFYGFGGQTYWGTMPFTDYPHYMGIIVFLLGIFALIKRRKDWLVIFLGLEIVIALLISFGKNLPFFYTIFYDYFPYFDKFRVPVMMLILVQFGFAILAGLGLQSLLESIKNYLADRKTQGWERKALITGGIIIGVLLVMTVLKGAFQGFITSFYPSQYEPQTQQQLNQMRFDLFFADFWIAGVVVAASMFLLYATLAQKIKLASATVALIFIILIDLWLVIGKINNPVPDQQMEAFLQEDQVAQYLKKDNDTFRIFPVNADFARLNLFGENRWAAQGLQSIGGYHAAKLQAYQDFLDGTQFSEIFLNKYFSVQNVGGQNRLVQNNPDSAMVAAQNNLLDFLNVKYLLSAYPVPDQNYSEQTQARVNFQGQTIPLRIIENTDVEQRAFLVSDYSVYDDAKVLLSELATGQLNPLEKVGLTKEPGILPAEDAESRVEIENYGPHNLSLRTQSATPQLLVISEPYYPVGWKATVDGAEVEILQANHAFRAIALEAGEHTVEFQAVAPAYQKGKWISLLCFLIVVGMLIGGGIREEKGDNSSPGAD